MIFLVFTEFFQIFMCRLLKPKHVHSTLPENIENINFMYQCISSTPSVIQYIDVLHVLHH